MVNTQELKNPEAPGGRKDWIGRTPRWRMSLTEADIRVLIEALEYFVSSCQMGSNDTYDNLLLRLHDAADSLQKPLTSPRPLDPLFSDTDITFGEDDG